MHVSRSPRTRLALGALALALAAALVGAARADDGAGPVRAQQATATPTASPTPADLILDGGRAQLSGPQVFDRVILRNRARLEIQPYSGRDDTGRLEIVARYVEVDRTSSILGSEAGYRGESRGDGEGPGGGEGGLRTADGGAGGGYGGRGGDGVLDNRPEPGARGGRAYGTADGPDIDRGSAGGSPGVADGGSDRAAGGNGGAALSIVAETLILTGTIEVNGAEGVVAANDAGGGGAGGGVLLRADRIEQSGRIEANGGDGAEVDDGGGGGGGGRIKIFYGRGTVSRRSLSVEGGRGDGNGLGNDGRRGTIHIETLPPTPTPSPPPTEPPSETPPPEPTATASPSPTVTTAASATPRPSATPTPSPSPTATTVPRPVFLPLALRERCPKAELRPIALALVLDASTSMRDATPEGPSKFEAARDAAYILIDLLVGGAEGHRMAVVSFQGEARVETALTASRQRLRGAVRGIVTAPGSRLDAGIAAGMSSLAGLPAETDRRIVLVTDGRPSPSTPAEAEAAAERARAAGIAFDTIGLGRDVDADLLRRVAGDDARYHEAPGAEALAKIFADLARVPPPCGGLPMWPAGSEP